MNTKYFLLLNTFNWVSIRIIQSPQNHWVMQHDILTRAGQENSFKNGGSVETDTQWIIPMGEAQQKIYSWVWEWSQMDNPQRVGYSGEVDMQRRVNKFLVDVTCPCILPIEIHRQRLSVLACRGEQSLGARSHGSVPGRGEEFYQDPSWLCWQGTECLLFASTGLL